MRFFKQHVLIEISWFTRVFLKVQNFLYPPELCSENLKNKKFKNIKILKIFSWDSQMSKYYSKIKRTRWEYIYPSRSVHFRGYYRFLIPLRSPELTLGKFHSNPGSFPSKLIENLRISLISRFLGDFLSFSLQARNWWGYQNFST